ncbi:MAG TPA: cytochrome b N-terminal domain-containing protein [Terracidiphilus sp.]|jgi:cytochrome b6|nr:cytochrome b N-terminal domain-containing protein [Terracidiphilus sp.]
MTSKTIATSAYDWVDERLGLSEMAAFARHKTVPVHAQSFWYYWGGISLFLFLVQCFTGVLLLVYYHPGVDAYESVRQITFVMHFGWLIRSAHSWSANLMIFSILVHMFSVYFMKAYRKPREFGWLSGMALLGLASVFGFSGYLLPMDELSYFATKVGLQIPAAIPWIGPIIGNMLRGGLEVNEFTVQRFFALHVVVLPALFLPLLGFHLWLVQRHGNALPPSEQIKRAVDRKTMPFFPNFMRKDLAMWLIALNILALLASVFPWSLGKPADMLVPAPMGIHPEWYFMSPFQMLKLLGAFMPGEAGEIAGILIFTLGIALWVLIPFYDTTSDTGRRARAAHYFGLLAVFALLVTTALGYWTIR